MYYKWIASITESVNLEVCLRPDQGSLSDCIKEIEKIVFDYDGRLSQPVKVQRYGTEVHLTIAMDLSFRSSRYVRTLIQYLDCVLWARFHDEINGWGGGGPMFFLLTGTHLIPSSSPMDPPDY